jgi:hypothetical protein
MRGKGRGKKVKRLQEEGKAKIHLKSDERAYYFQKKEVPPPPDVCSTADDKLQAALHTASKLVDSEGYKIWEGNGGVVQFRKAIVDIKYQRPTPNKQQRAQMEAEVNGITATLERMDISGSPKKRWVIRHSQEAPKSIFKMRFVREYNNNETVSSTQVEETTNNNNMDTEKDRSHQTDEGGSSSHQDVPEGVPAEPQAEEVPQGIFNAALDEILDYLKEFGKGLEEEFGEELQNNSEIPTEEEEKEVPTVVPMEVVIDEDDNEVEEVSREGETPRTVTEGKEEEDDSEDAEARLERYKIMADYFTQRPDQQDLAEYFEKKYYSLLEKIYLDDPDRD